MTKEQEINHYMTALDISREEAEQLWQDDHDDMVTPEMAEMEAKAKKNRRYEKSDTLRKKTVRERKIDTEKVFLLNLFRNCFPDDVTINIIETKEGEFSFLYGENSYTVKLIKHRPKK